MSLWWPCTEFDTSGRAEGRAVRPPRAGRRPNPGPCLSARLLHERQAWRIDLSAYAGKKVEVSISYVSDWFTQGLGVFVDDATVNADGAPVSTTSFESDLGGWTVSGAAPGSPTNPNDWIRSQPAFDEGAAITTNDTVYIGFGAEGLTTQAQRTDFIRRAMHHLLH